MKFKVKMKKKKNTKDIWILTIYNFFFLLQSISPGIVKTPILKSCLGDEIDRMCYEKNTYLQTEDIAAAVEYILGTPAHVQVPYLFSFFLSANNPCRTSK